MDERRRLRKFGIILAIVLFFAAAINLYKKNISLAVFLCVIDLFVVLFAIANPLVLTPVYRFLVFISHIIGWVNTRLLLCGIYYLIFTPIGLVMRIFGRDPLDRKFVKKRTSYWIPHDDEFQPERCERQF